MESLIKKTTTITTNHRRNFILYCSLAGFISAWAISGLLVIVDIISSTPPGTFFAVIGVSLGFNDPIAAQYIGFVLHVITGMAAGNVFGQISLFWSKIAPYNSKEGIVKGLAVGMALWIVLFVPLATFGIQPRLDSFAFSAPNQYIFNISSHFQALYPIIIGGSLVFHLIYGALLGFIAGRMVEIGMFTGIKRK
ncbi:MAG TPA: hypothetical protein VFI70_12645 [Nitrososphaeraceae archaeon]|nr:hypothetical protein [Nitrososphaeraceae archaeon]